MRGLHNQQFDPNGWRRLASRPSLFARHFLKDGPHPGQATWLENSNEHINTLVPGNRWGKTYVIGMKHIHKCVFKKGLPPMEQHQWLSEPYQTVSTAPSFDQAGLVYKAVRHLVSTDAMRPLVKKWRATPFPSVEFWNGSVLHVRSLHDDARYVDGHGYRYLSVDEAGWIPNLRKLIDQVLMLRLAGGGELDLIGTPKGKNDLYWYFKQGEKGEPEYYAQRGSIFDNPFLPQEDLAVRARLLEASDPKTRAQVLYGEFVDFEGLAFTEDQIVNATDEGWKPLYELHGEMLFEDYDPRRRYITAWDLGRITDYTVGVTLDISSRPWRLVRFDRLNKVPWESIYRLMDQVRRRYDCQWVTIDATGPQGDVIEEELLKRGVPVNGVKTSGKSQKLTLINGLQAAFDEGRRVDGEYQSVEHDGTVRRRPRLQEPGEGNWGLLRMPLIPQLRAELEMYMLDDKDLVQDSVFALALAVSEARNSEYLGPAAIGGIYWAGGDVNV